MARLNDGSEGEALATLVAKLAGGVAVINVGTESEVKEKKARRLTCPAPLVGRAMDG